MILRELSVRIAHESLKKTDVGRQSEAARRILFDSLWQVAAIIDHGYCSEGNARNVSEICSSPGAGYQIRDVDSFKRLRFFSIASLAFLVARASCA
jgi:hypothetical protein